MSYGRTHRELEVWQWAMDLADEVHRLCLRFPAEARYVMVGQLMRAVILVPGNIAEGKGLATSKEYAQYLAIARGSLAEAETYLLLAVRFTYIAEADAGSALGLVIRVNQMLNRLRGSIRDAD